MVLTLLALLSFLLATSRAGTATPTVSPTTIAPTTVAPTVAPTPAPILPYLAISLVGSGSGMVTSSPAGISCPSTCTHPFPANTTVTLTPTPNAGSVFLKWTDASHPDCQDDSMVLVDTTLTCVASFLLIPTPNGTCAYNGDHPLNSCASCENWCSYDPMLRPACACNAVVELCTGNGVGFPMFEDFGEMANSTTDSVRCGLNEPDSFCDCVNGQFSQYFSADFDNSTTSEAACQDVCDSMCGSGSNCTISNQVAGAPTPPPTPAPTSSPTVPPPTFAPFSGTHPLNSCVDCFIWCEVSGALEADCTNSACGATYQAPGVCFSASSAEYCYCINATFKGIDGVCDADTCTPINPFTACTGVAACVQTTAMTTIITTMGATTTIAATTVPVTTIPVTLFPTAPTDQAKYVWLIISSIVIFVVLVGLISCWCLLGWADEEDDRRKKKRRKNKSRSNKRRSD